MASMLQFAQDLSNLPLPAAASAADRAQRSVFVGNIPYDATEEQLREVFIQAGPVVSFRLVYDRETGKPKGYGFCEYQDVETAQSAMRNLNNYDFNGRPLRVGVAAGEQSKDEGKALQQALGGQIVESPYGEPVEPEKAPEAISKAVASLPPEQMFELMKQMKLCIQNNPNEARNMLLQNPQLAYALLQAQIVMKIVDPQVAMSMLYRDETQPQVSVPNNAPKAMPGSQPVIGQPVVGQQVVGQQVVGQQVMGQQVMGQQVMGQQVMGQPRMQQGLPVPMGGVNPGFIGINPGAMNPQMRPDMMVRQNLPQEVGDARRFPQPNNMPGPGVRMQAPGMMPNQRPVMNQPNNPMPGAAGPSANGTANISTQDQEKAALIMQVLQLTDEQIALLPPEQRHSILILKEQIKSG